MTIGILNGNGYGIYLLNITLNPASVAAATVAEQTFTVTGLRTSDFVSLAKPSATAGIGIVSCRVSAADTLAVQIVNPTAGSIDPPSESYFLTVLRPESGVGATKIGD